MRILSIDVGYRNLAYCILEEGFIREWQCIDVISENEGAALVSKGRVDPVLLGLLVASLVKREEVVLDVDVVVIERQPPRAKLNRMVEAAIMAYFLTMMQTRPSRIQSVQSFDAKDKFQDVEKRKPLRGKKHYRARKNEAVDRCREYLERTGQPSSLFDSAKKKDDLADSMLQAVAYEKTLPKPVPGETSVAPIEGTVQ